MDDVVITYAEFLERVTSCAVWLLRSGFQPGMVTGLALQDEIEHLIAAMTLLCLQTPQINLGSHEAGATKRALVRKVGARQLVGGMREDWMDGLSTWSMPGGAKRDAATPGIDFVAGPLGAICLYQNTSGSTRIPKTFGLTVERLRLLSARYASDPKEHRALRTGSIEFDAHRLHRICSLLAGNTCIFLRQLNLQNLVAVCERESVSTLGMGAYKLASLLKADACSSSRLPTFTAVQTGGTRVPGWLRTQLKRFLTDNIWVLYATSEVGMISVASPDQHETFPEGVGFPAAGVTVEVINPNGELVGPGEIGQIRVRKAGMASGYVAEAAALNYEDGWFYPRDLVSLKRDEPLVFHGRADDVMILNGINVFPSAIEDTLESHPDVKEAVAYAIKSRVHGEIPVAAVVLKPNAQDPRGAQLLNLCRQVLGIRAPRQIFVVDRIPRNAAGKPLRRELAFF